MNSVTLKVEGMHCDGCAILVKRVLERTRGVREASASFRDAEARVLHDPALASLEQLTEVIERAGYRVTGAAPSAK